MDECIVGSPVNEGIGGAVNKVVAGPINEGIVGLVKLDAAETFSRLVASEAVADVIGDVQKAKIPPEQVKAIASATTEVLAGREGFDIRAKAELAEAFEDDAVDEIFERIVKRAA